MIKLGVLDSRIGAVVCERRRRRRCFIYKIKREQRKSLTSGRTVRCGRRASESFIRSKSGDNEQDDLNDEIVWLRGTRGCGCGCGIRIGLRDSNEGA